MNQSFGRHPRPSVDVCDERLFHKERQKLALTGDGNLRYRVRAFISTILHSGSFTQHIPLFHPHSSVYYNAYSLHPLTPFRTPLTRMTAAGQLQREEPFLVPNISDPVFHKEGGLKDMIWFIVGALQQSAPQPLTVQQICTVIEEHQSWRIAECRGDDKRGSAESNIRWILSKSPAFGHDSAGYWHMTGRPLVRTPNMLPPPMETQPVMTEAEIRAYLAWANQLFAPFNRFERVWSESESPNSGPSWSRRFDSSTDRNEGGI